MSKSSDYNDLEKELFELRDELDMLRIRDRAVFGRDFRIGMFLLCLAFVCVAGHWIVAAAAWFVMKDAVFARS